MREEWPRHYILVDRQPMAVDMMTWARWFEENDRQIAHTILDNTPVEKEIGFITKQKYMTVKLRVSTVFLGLDHNFRIGPGSEHSDPILFETMIFGGPLDGEMWRYHTYAEAERGHEAAVAQARIASAKVKAIADAAGAKGNVE